MLRVRATRDAGGSRETSMKLKPRQRASARRAPRWSRACLAFGRAALPKRVPAQGALRDNKTTSTPSQRNLRALRGAPYALWAAIALLQHTRLGCMERDGSANPERACGQRFDVMDSTNMTTTTTSNVREKSHSPQAISIVRNEKASHHGARSASILFCLKFATLRERSKHATRPSNVNADIRPGNERPFRPLREAARPAPRTRPKGRTFVFAWLDTRAGLTFAPALALAKQRQQRHLGGHMWAANMMMWRHLLGALRPRPDDADCTCDLHGEGLQGLSGHAVPLPEERGRLPDL